MTRVGGFCTWLDMTLPVVQAPIGSAATPELAAAVSGAGGLGTLAGSWTRPDRLAKQVRQVQTMTPRPFGVNLVLQWPQQERLSVLLEEGVAVISTAWGDPGPLVEQVHRAGALHVHAVGSADEARRAVAAGVDAVVAQGCEAGGHVLGTVSTLALVPAVVDAVAPVPVLAAGGVADGRGLAAVLALGAEAAWIGTRFVASEEAAAHPHYQARLLDAAETSTVHGTVFDGGWPAAPHRTLHNSTVQTWQTAGEPLTDRPGERDLIATTASGAPVPRYSSDVPTRTMTGDVEAMALYAGQGVGVVRDIAPAARIARQLSDDALATLAEALVRRRSGL